MTFKLEKKKWGKEIEYSKNHVICRIAYSKANQDKMFVRRRYLKNWFRIPNACLASGSYHYYEQQNYREFC